MGQAVEASEKLKKELADLKEKHTFMSEGEIVCDACGVRCSPDEKADYQAHLEGRLHESYVKIRTTVKDLREKVKNRSKVDSEDKEKADKELDRKDRDRE